MTFAISLDWVFVKIAFDWVELVGVRLVLFFAVYACFFLSMCGVDLLAIFGVFAFVDEFAALGAVCSLGVRGRVGW